MSKKVGESSKGRRKRPSDVTPLRRSLRLSSKFTPIATSLYSRSTLPQYSENYYENESTSVLDESGQSVPIDFDRDVVHHDHSYSQVTGPTSKSKTGQAKKRDHRSTREGSIDEIRESTPNNLYGLDGNEEELTQLRHSHDYDLYNKERILTPPRPGPVEEPGPSMCAQFMSSVYGFFRTIGSVVYLLFAKLILCDLPIYSRSTDCCGKFSRNIFQSATFFTICLGIVFVICTVPYVKHPPPPPPPKPLPPPILPLNGTLEELRRAVNRLEQDLHDYKRKQTDTIDVLERLVKNNFDNIADELDNVRASMDEKIAREVADRDVMKEEMTVATLTKKKELNDAIQSVETRLTTLIEQRAEEASKMDSTGVRNIAQGIVNDAVSQLTQSLASKLELLNNTLYQLKGGQVESLSKTSEHWRAKLIELEDKQARQQQDYQKGVDSLQGVLSSTEEAQKEEIAKLKGELKDLSNTITSLEQDIDALNQRDWTLPSSVLTNDTVVRMIQDALDKYSADQVARFDFALESAGGHVHASSETFDPSETKPLLFGITLPISLSRSFPSMVIQPAVMPGDCWCFKGSEGYVVIKLAVPAIVDAVTVQHLPKELSPDGTIASAMKSFTVKGLDSLTDEGTVLGRFEYTNQGPPIQPFTIVNTKSFGFIRFDINSNHGNPDFTCIYRLRVHGSLTDS